MKQLILAFFALFMISSASAYEYLYIEDFNVNSNQIGTQITVPIKAHFDYYVSAFFIELTYPEGLTPVSAEAGSDQTIPYYDKTGKLDYYNTLFRFNEELTRFVCANTIAGYWLQDDQWETYGVVKWDPGDYDEMIKVTFNVGPEFRGGEITVHTEASSGKDTRGEICQLMPTTLTTTVTSDWYGPDPDPDPVVENKFTMSDDISIFSGDTFVIPVTMTNSSAITAFQTDIYLPDGFEVVQENGDYAVEWSNRVTSDHTIMASNISDHVVRLICFSPSLQPFAGNDGVLFNITIKSRDGLNGVYPIVLTNSLWTTTDDQELRIDDATCQVTAYSFIIGDANKSGSVTVTDVVTTARYILNQNPTPFIFEAADMNGDGNITVTDVVLISRLVMNAQMNMPRRMPSFEFTNDCMSGDDITIGDGETRTVAIKLDNVNEYTAFQFEMSLPEGMTASDFTLTSRAGNHTIEAVPIGDGKMRILCYSPVTDAIAGHDGALLAFNVTANRSVAGEIVIDRIEMVGMSGQMFNFDIFALKVNNNATHVKEVKAAPRIYSDGHDIIVECAVDMTVLIADMAGHTQLVKAHAGRNVFPTQNSGVYAVNAGGVTAKLELR